MARPRVVLIHPTDHWLLEEVRNDLRFALLGEEPPGPEIVNRVCGHKPDLIVCDIGSAAAGWPEVIEGLVLCSPHATVAVLSDRCNAAVASAFMRAGADDLLIRPFQARDLLDRLHSLHEHVVGRKRHWIESGLPLVDPPRPKLIVVFSPKGGVGKTTVAVNLASALHRLTEQSVVLVDGDVEGSDVAVTLALNPKLTMTDYAEALQIDQRVALDPYLAPHLSGLKVLAAPRSPEQAEKIGPAVMKTVVTMAKQQGEFVVADTSPSYSEPVLTLLDEADTILLLLTPDLIALHSVRGAATVMKQLQYPRDKIKVVVNRSSVDLGLRVQQVEEVLGMPVFARIPDDPRAVLSAVNHGIPCVVEAPKAPVSRAVMELARQLAGSRGDQTGAARANGLFKFLHRSLLRKPR